MSARKISVAGIACNGGRLFIARRKAGGALGEKWEFPGGKTEEGESPEAAVAREYSEEFALSVQTKKCIAVSSFKHNEIIFDLYAYHITLGDNAARDIKLSEHTEWRWAGFDEIKTLDFADSDKTLLPALEAYFNQKRGFDH